MKYITMILIWSVAILSVYINGMLFSQKESYFNFLTIIYFIGVFIFLGVGIVESYLNSKKQNEDAKRRRDEWEKIHGR